MAERPIRVTNNVASASTPCDACTLAAVCARGRLACERFSRFVYGGARRAAGVPCRPTRRLYENLFDAVGVPIANLISPEQQRTLAYARTSAWRHQHGEHMRAYDREQYRNHRERVLAKNARHYACNGDAIRERRRAKHAQRKALAAGNEIARAVAGEQFASFARSLEVDGRPFLEHQGQQFGRGDGAQIGVALRGEFGALLSSQAP
jgi:hypothetical protein